MLARSPAPLIVGAGLAGLIAAHIFPRSFVHEQEDIPKGGRHKALLRFRSDEVSKAVDIPFTKVRVHKGLWHSGRMFGRADIRHMNLYASKVASTAGVISSRSIADLSAVDRWVAPPTLYEQMLQRVIEEKRIAWLSDGFNAGHDGAIVSTAPLPQVLQRFKMPCEERFASVDVLVHRYHVHDADLHQTIYYPSDSHATYRASITGSTMIVESIDTGATPPLNEEELAESFGIGRWRMELEEEVTRQRYGKIFPIDNRVRRELLHQLTVRYKVFSVGRFATWRNVLLDDVLKDTRIVRSMIEQSDAYDLRLKA